MNLGGLRTKNKIKKYQENTPLITVITVVYNGFAVLEKTILSIVSQTYSNIEYIIIDGASTDSTLEIITKYEDKIDFWISEPDNGIYYAMNKGIELATGEWINFMNCGDEFYSRSVVSELFSHKDYCEIDIIVGTTFIRSNWGNYRDMTPKKDEIWKYFCHQAVFSRRHINLAYPFDTFYKISADFNFIYSVFRSQKNILTTNKIVCSVEYSNESFSSKNIIRSRIEELLSVMSFKNSFIINHFCFHLYSLFRAIVSVLLQKTFPKLILKYRKTKIQDRLNK